VLNVSDKGAEVTSDKVYAGIQDRGGVIRRKSAPWLVFQLPDGSWRKAKQVTIKATRYISRGVESKREEIQAFVRKHLKQVHTRAALAAGRARTAGGRFA